MKLILISMFMFLIGSCENLSFKKDDELSLNRENYEGNQLRIDGYYYHEYYNPDKNMESIVFFKNGVLSYFGGGGKSFGEIENRLTNNELIEKLKGIKDCWGIFNVKNNIIKFERWYGGQGAKPVYVSEGVILNDTTFHITKSYRSDGSEIEPEDQMYHFRQFSPKPDSTNVFIK